MNDVKYFVDDIVDGLFEALNGQSGPNRLLTLNTFNAGIGVEGIDVILTDGSVFRINVSQLKKATGEDEEV